MVYESLGSIPVLSDGLIGGLETDEDSKVVALYRRNLQDHLISK